MTLTPAGHARRANACRTIAALLEQWGSPYPDTRAAQILTELEGTGWCPPRELTHMPAARGNPADHAARHAAMQQIRATLNRRETEENR